MDERKIDLELSEDMVIVEDNRCVGRPSDLEDINHIIRERYIMVLDVFKHLSASAEDHRTASLELSEFKNFVYRSSLFDGVRSLPMGSKIDELFAASGGCSKATQAEVLSLNRGQFVSSLIRLASLRYIETLSGKKKKKKKGSRSKESTSSDKSSLPQAVKMLIEGSVAEWVDDHSLGSSLHRVLTAPPTLALLFDFHSSLSRVFRDYASRAGDGDDVMNLDEFDLLMADGGFIPPFEGEGGLLDDYPEMEDPEPKGGIGWSEEPKWRSESPGKKEEEQEGGGENSGEGDEWARERTMLSAVDVRTAFSLSQSEFNYGIVDLISEGEEIPSDIVMDEDHKKEMTYPEFLESIAR